MSIEIVTGFQGVEHIEPAQVGRLLASLVGTECYVVGEGDPLSATVRTANQVRIGAGEIIMQGRHITCESYTDLTIESGTTGYKRNDLVVCRYERSSSTGVESATLKVVKGTATAGTPSDPSYVSGSIIDNDLIVEMPLWRIPITNLTPGTPVKLFSALPYGTLDNILDRLATAEEDIEDTRDSISQPELIASNETGSFRVYRIGCIAFISLFSFQTSVSAFNSNVIWNLEQGVRPITTFSVPIRSSLSESGGSVSVKPTGEVEIAAGASALQNAYYDATLVFPIAD